MKRGKGAIAGLFLALAVTLLAVTPAAAGLEWCVRDPIFVIDGRVVQVKLLVPPDNVNAKLNFVLSVAKGSIASYSFPPGESIKDLNGGTVTIVTDDDVKRDKPLLRVTGEGPRFDMIVQVSGTGLRSEPFEKRGTSKGTTVAIHLDRTGK